MNIFKLCFYAQPVQFPMQKARDHDIFGDPSENQIFENASKNLKKLIYDTFETIGPCCNLQGEAE